MQIKPSYRQDSFEVRPKQMSRTPEGFLDIHGIAAKVGRLVYTWGEEYVEPQALSSSLVSLKHAPVTLEHPPGGKITPENARALSVGFVTDASFREDSGEQHVSLRIIDREAIEDILNGARVELSQGYDVSTFGEYEGIQSQTGRHVNHIAVTGLSRAGVGLRLDSKRGEENVADAENQTIQDLRGRVKALESEKQTAEGRADAAEKALAQRNDAADAAERAFPARFKAHAQALEVAKRLGIEAREDQPTLEIQRAVAKKHLGDGFRADSTDDYILAAFDFAAKHVPARNSATDVLETLRTDSVDRNAVPEVSAEQAFLDNLSSQCKGN